MVWGEEGASKGVSWKGVVYEEYAAAAAAETFGNRVRDRVLLFVVRVFSRSSADSVGVIHTAGRWDRNMR